MVVESVLFRFVVGRFVAHSGVLRLVDQVELSGFFRDVILLQLVIGLVVFFVNFIDDFVAEQVQEIPIPGIRFLRHGIDIVVRVGSFSVFFPGSSLSVFFGVGGFSVFVGDVEYFALASDIDTHGLGLQGKLGIHVERRLDTGVLISANTAGMIGVLFIGNQVVAFREIAHQVLELVENVGPFIGLAQVDIGLGLGGRDRLRLGGLAFPALPSLGRLAVEIEVVRQGRIVIEAQLVDPGLRRVRFTFGEDFRGIDFVRRVGQELVDRRRRGFQNLVDFRLVLDVNFDRNGVAGGFADLILVENPPLDACVLDADIRSGQLVQRLEQRRTLFRRDRLRQAFVIEGLGFEFGEVFLGKPGSFLFRSRLRQVLERVERMPAAAAADLSRGLLENVCGYAKRRAAFRALCVHCLALSPRTRQPRPRLAVLFPEYRLIERDPGVERRHDLVNLFT